MQYPHRIPNPGWETFALPHGRDALDLYLGLRDLEWPLLLDGGCSRDGRLDILCADPIARIVTRGQVTSLESGGATRTIAADPFDAVRRSLQEYRPRGAQPPGFFGGAVGYFAYDLGRRVERLPSRAAADIAAPEMAVGIYPWAVVIDHERNCTEIRFSPLVGANEREQLRERLLCARRESTCESFRLLSPLESNLTPVAYRDAVTRILEYIRAGDCYQVNLAQRFSAQCSGDAFALYTALRRRMGGRYSAWLEIAGQQIASFSPEQFLEMRGGRVTTRPIKGTRPRSPDATRDAELADALRSSAKDRAENLMIVDLLRNDLGRACVPGSVRVPELFALDSQPNVHHLVSTITGRPGADRDALHLLRACFPGGSITGAPKIRAMEIIEELEPHRRSIYTGSIACIGFDGAMDSSILIRTLLCSDGRVHCWGGGGIVADSDCEEEYRESLDKIGWLLEAIARCAPLVEGA